jgi:hypothetical protein
MNSDKHVLERSSSGKSGICGLGGDEEVSGKANISTLKSLEKAF